MLLMNKQMEALVQEMAERAISTNEHFFEEIKQKPVAVSNTLDDLVKKIELANKNLQPGTPTNGEGKRVLNVRDDSMYYRLRPVLFPNSLHPQTHASYTAITQIQVLPDPQ